LLQLSETDGSAVRFVEALASVLPDVWPGQVGSLIELSLAVTPEEWDWIISDIERVWEKDGETPPTSDPCGGNLTASTSSPR
jgi:hypothetical protein